MDRCAPEDLIGHPIADPREPLLHQQHRFDGRASPALKKLGHRAGCKCGGKDGGCQLPPPDGGAGSDGELHPAEHARILEYEAPHRRVQNEMIVFRRNIARPFAPQRAAHPEVNAQPAVAAESEQHLFGRGH